MQTVNFNGHQLETFEDDGRKWVVIKRVCENIGISSARQQDKLKKDSQFTYTHMCVRDTLGRIQDDTGCIPLDEYNMWLCSINAKKAKNLLLRQVKRNNYSSFFIFTLCSFPDSGNETLKSPLPIISATTNSLINLVTPFLKTIWNDFPFISIRSTI